jgi:hypothetical protein
MSGFFSFVGKTLLNLVFWVFVFSIPVANKPVFEYLQRVLVYNPPVRFLSAEWTHLWGMLSEKTEVAFSDKREGKELHEGNGAPEDKKEGDSLR